MFTEYHVIQFILHCLMANTVLHKLQRVQEALVLNSITVQTVYNSVYN